MDYRETLEALVTFIGQHVQIIAGSHDQEQALAYFHGVLERAFDDVDTAEGTVFLLRAGFTDDPTPVDERRVCVLGPSFTLPTSATSSWEEGDTRPAIRIKSGAFEMIVREAIIQPRNSPQDHLHEDPAEVILMAVLGFYNGFAFREHLIEMVTSTSIWSRGDVATAIDALVERDLVEEILSIAPYYCSPQDPIIALVGKRLRDVRDAERDHEAVARWP